MHTIILIMIIYACRGLIYCYTIYKIYIIFMCHNINVIPISVQYHRHYHLFRVVTLFNQIFYNHSLYTFYCTNLFLSSAIYIWSSDLKNSIQIRSFMCILLFYYKKAKFNFICLNTIVPATEIFIIKKHEF